MIKRRRRIRTTTEARARSRKFAHYLGVLTSGFDYVYWLVPGGTPLPYFAKVLDLKGLTPKYS